MGATDLADRLQQALGDAFVLERELEGGGMARVFVAADLRLGRTIVVKVLPPELARELSAERFEREIRLAARLQHPNIVPVLTAGESAGLTFYTMPFVRGESLRARLARALELRAALRILADVARALAFAHANGIVHRDVKPENVLLVDDVAVVGDFGIARAIDAARGGEHGDTITQLGAAVGTPAYMAPEQAAGDPGTDHRADIYAWGVLAYECLAGAHPFAHRRGSRELITAHLVELPVDLARRRSEMPPSVAALVMRCLAKAPTERPRSARELVEALERAAEPSDLSRPDGRGIVDRGAEPSIAVLPFVNVGADPDNDYFSDGITEEILNLLASDRALRVAARTSSFAFRGKDVDLRTVGAQLGVDALLEGSVRRAGNRVRITARLVSATDGFQLWSDRFERELTDIFAVQDEIASSIAATLVLALHGHKPPAAIPPRMPRDAGLGATPGIRERLGSRWARLFANRGAAVKRSPEQTRGADVNADVRQAPADKAPLAAEATHELELTVTDGGWLPPRVRRPASFAAYEAYLKGRHENHRRAEGMRAARDHFERALALDPDFAAAHAGLAQSYVWLGTYGAMPPGEAFARARRHAEQALALDPDLADAHDLLGYIALWHDWDAAACERHVRRALDRQPDNPDALMLAAYLRLVRGQRLASLAAVDAAVRADPIGLGTRMAALTAYYLAWEFDRAIWEADRLLAEHPESGEARMWRAMAAYTGGDLHRARADLEDAAERMRRPPLVLAHLAMVHSLEGRERDARRMRDELLERASREWIPPIAIGLAELALGDYDAALLRFERAYESRDFLMPFLHITPMVHIVRPGGRPHPITDDPRWGALLARVGMAPLVEP